MPQSSGFSSYFPPGPEHGGWGLQVTNCGWTRIPAGSPYPPGRHPDDYMFTWAHGRHLRGWHIVYIDKGAGRFEAKPGGAHYVEAGDLFILFPEVWHRYKPDPSTGWDEYWFGFQGPWADDVMKATFKEQVPILRHGSSARLKSLFLDGANTMREALPGSRRLLAARVFELVAQMQAWQQQQTTQQTSELHAKINRAAQRLLDLSQPQPDLYQLAADMRLSYTAFRRAFKAQIGVPPGQFHQQALIEQASRLLLNTQLPIKEIADRLGFESALYFSRIFKKKTGLSPLHFRQNKSTLWG